MRRRGWVVALLLVLTGCAQVPSSGPIVEVEQSVPQVGSSSFVRALARPPVPGMTQVEVVQGFLDAASGFEDGHAVARQYLTEQASRTWAPDAGARVYVTDSETLTPTSEQQVSFTATQMAAISARSQYRPAPPGATLTEQFGLVRQGDDWRIQEVPQGLLLSRAAVERSYREFQTYYVAEPGGVLAPNPVLFASSQRDVTAGLLRSLLAGPGPWLAPAVINAFPPGTRLDSVSSADGVLRVDLSEEVLRADDLARQQLSAQIVWTLRQVSGMRAVEITAAGQPFTVPGAPAVQPRTAWPEYDPDVLPADAPWFLIRSGAVMAATDASAVEPVAGAAGLASPAVRQPLISLDRAALAATDRRSVLLTAQMQPGARWRTARTTGTSAGGSWDRTGLLWLPGPESGAQVVTVLGSQSVRVPLAPVRSVQISRDGSRALVVAGPRPSAQAYLLRVDRDGSVPRLGQPRAMQTGPVRAAAWSSATQVALLTKEPGQPPQVATVDLGLFTVRLLGGPPHARTVAAAPARPLLSGTADGQIWQFNGTTWIPAMPGRQPRYPG